MNKLIFQCRVSSQTSGAFSKAQKTSWRRPPQSQFTLLQIRFRAYSTPSSQNNRPVRIVEVGPRDGLQNIKQIVPTAVKVELIQRLAKTGLLDIEATSFVSPKWVPQLADGAEVISKVLALGSQHPQQLGEIRFPVLAPNAKGLENASKAGAKEIVVFASCTEEFSRRNQNCTIDQALAQAKIVTEDALKKGILVRGVVSCIFSDPYTGPTAPEDVLRIVKSLLSMGCYEVGLGDTLGVGTPYTTQKLLEVLLKDIPAEKLAGHFHDTYGQAIANIVKAYDMGIRTFDSSVAGLGGCPYAVGAKGNVATEDVIYTLEESGINTGVDIDKLISVGEWISGQLGIPYGSRAGAALSAKRAVSGKPPQKSSINPPHKAASLLPVSSTRSWKVIEDTGEYRVSRAGAALKITLTRPKNGNALTNNMLTGLTDIFRQLATDTSIFHVLVEAEGKFFCTGMDLSGTTNTSDMSKESTYYSKVVDLYHAIDHAPQTTIAVVDGPAFGGGVGLTFICDVRLVSTRARWTLSEIKLGIAPAIISRFMTREWGVAFFREAMLSGREVNPAELHRFGVVHGISEGGEALEQAAEAYLDRLSGSAPRSAAVCKELVRLGWYGPEGTAQEQLIEKTFGNMMAPGSEGEYGIKQFQKKVKKVDWSGFWASQNAKIS